MSKHSVLLRRESIRTTIDAVVDVIHKNKIIELSKQYLYRVDDHLSNASNWSDNTPFDIKCNYDLDVVEGIIAYIEAEKDLTGGGAGAPILYTNLNATPDDVGGISAGSSFNSRTMQQMWDALLYPYQNPAFTSFYIQGQTSVLECGDTSLANPDFRWSTSNSGNINPNSIDIDDVTGGVNLHSGLANDGQENTAYAGVTRNTPSSYVYRITGTNTNAANFSRNYQINWRWRMYYGESSDTPLVEADIEGLRVNLLTHTAIRTYAFNGGGYKYICYPQSFGALNTFTDTSTGLSVPFEAPYTVAITNAFGQTTNFNVYRSTNIMGGSINIAVT